MVDMVGGFPDVRQDHVVFSKLFPEGETSARSLLKSIIIQSKTECLTLNIALFIRASFLSMCPNSSPRKI